MLPKIFVLNRVSGLKGFGGTPLPRLPLSASWVFFPKPWNQKSALGTRLGFFLWTACSRETKILNLLNKKVMNKKRQPS